MHSYKPSLIFRLHAPALVDGADYTSMTRLRHKVVLKFEIKPVTLV